ncbi:MAG: hypothetical protein CVT88_00125 [Candidatus Altiarchaeales archaeon HGW-Altiarchaeales-1]|nr:MAG: hypothetical protein CVT89_07015 [Candidatus Altiarchaeales archaeon HGW-Altiarchaeales-2]PKP61433.1 MAG: hypothetical protein CVT88_00125 [Candidatus Altiarchaeales archaeon HGW-Altiarchaeales-1]
MKIKNILFAGWVIAGIFLLATLVSYIYLHNFFNYLSNIATTMLFLYFSFKLLILKYEDENSTKIKNFSYLF